MKMIVGLGNPGAKYAATRHNIGFITIDEIAHRHNFQLNKSKFDAVYAEEFIGHEKVLFVKPLTYMNESGRAVRPLADYFGIDDEDIVIIYDDVDLPVGTIRLRQSGSAGGQNGMKDIISHMGTNQLKRIRIGISQPRPGQNMVQHVLSRFSKEENEDILYAVTKASDAVEYWIEGHTYEDTMSHYNG